MLLVYRRETLITYAHRGEYVESKVCGLRIIRAISGCIRSAKVVLKVEITEFSRTRGASDVGAYVPELFMSERGRLDYSVYPRRAKSSAVTLKLPR